MRPLSPSLNQNPPPCSSCSKEQPAKKRTTSPASKTSSPSRPPDLHHYMAVSIRAMARKIDVSLARRSPWQTGSLDGLPSPTSPLDLSVSRGWLHRESGGVGLGILAALEAQPSPAAARVFASIASQRRAVRLEISELGCSGRCATSLCGAGETFRVADFLGCCDRCRRPLDGKDIFMYRGDRAFCSTECRYQAIVSDEFQEEKERKLRAGAVLLGAPKEVVAEESAGLPCADSGRIFFTGIGVA